MNKERYIEKIKELLKDCNANKKDTTLILNAADFVEAEIEYEPDYRRQINIVFGYPTIIERRMPRGTIIVARKSSNGNIADTWEGLYDKN